MAKKTVRQGRWNYEADFTFMHKDKVTLKDCRVGAVTEIEALIKIVLPGEAIDLTECRDRFTKATSTKAYDRAMARFYDLADSFGIWVRTR